MKSKFLSLILISALAFSLILTGCGEDKQEAQPNETQAVTQSLDYTDSEKLLTDYFSSFTQGDNPLYGTWKISNFEYISFIFRNDGFAEMAMGTEGSFSELVIDEKNKTLTTQFFIGLNGTYDYQLSQDNQTLTLTLDGEETVLTKQDNYDFVPEAPSKPAIDEELVGWWKGEHGLIYYFGADGIMYSNIISAETCYTYNAENNKITAVYDIGGEVTDEIEYKLKNKTLTIDGNKYTPFNPFEE